jgi:serine/threonine protein kinase
VLDLIDGEATHPFLVMDLLYGETLAARLAREERLSVEETATILLPVVSALGAAHALGIIHRDLKPSNIFLCRDGSAHARVKVLDFGIAKWVGSDAAGSGLRTHTGTTLGTPCYMAPEQALNERQLDHRVDLWSLGVVLYECLSGIRPVEGENAAQMLLRLHVSGIYPIERLVPDIPEALALLIQCLLRRAPRQRPSDFCPVYDALQAFTQERPPRFGTPTLSPSQDLDANEHPSTLEPFASATPSVGPVSAPHQPPRSRRLMPRAWPAMTAAVILALGATLWIRSSTDLPPPPLVLDDFEDGDKLPKDPRFAIWQYFTFNPPAHEALTWFDADGHNSNHAIRLQWLANDPLDGKRQYPGAGLRSIAANGYVDLSPYTRFVFSHRYDGPGASGRLPISSTACRRDSFFVIGIHCSEFNTSYDFRVPVSETWTTRSVALADFREPEYLPPSGATLKQCLAVAEGLNFVIGAEVGDGECTSGILSLDDMSFR